MALPSWIETRYAALFDRLRQKVDAVPSWTRRYDDYMSTSADQQPAAVLIASSMTPDQAQGRPTKWRLEARLMVWCRQRNSADRASPDTTLNGILAQVDAALAWDPELDATSGFLGDRIHSTLGGLCAHAWISDVPEIVQGASGDESEAAIAIEMVGVSPTY